MSFYIAAVGVVPESARCGRTDYRKCAASNGEGLLQKQICRYTNPWAFGRPYAKPSVWPTFCQIYIDFPGQVVGLM